MRIGQKVWNDMFNHIQKEIWKQEGKEEILLSCPYLFYMDDEQFKQRYLEEEDV